MNEGVKVLIERMKTNPEDFQMHPIPQGVKKGRFYWITEEMQKYLNIQGGHYYMTLLKKDDLDALVDAFKDMYQQEFTDKVMKDLFREEEQIPTPSIAGGWMSNSTTISPLQNAMWTDPRLALLGQQQAHNQHLQAHIDARQQAMSQQAMSQQQQAMVGITSAHTGTGKGLLGGLTGLFK